MPRPGPRPGKTSPTPAENRLAPAAADRADVSRLKGDLPASILDRYLIEHDSRGRAERFFRDHRAARPAFRDAGRALIAAQPYPDVVVDMLRIARHRGWTDIRVRGETAFKREVWIQAQALDIAVEGHRPTERDRQAVGVPAKSRGIDGETRPRDRQPPPGTLDLEARMRLAGTVVRALIADPAARARLLDRAWTRAEAHLEHGQRFRSAPRPERSAGSREIDLGGRDRRRDRS
jgi:acetolactate synthase regulatory subunit